MCIRDRWYQRRVHGNGTRSSSQMRKASEQSDKSLQDPSLDNITSPKAAETKDGGVNNSNILNNQSISTTTLLITPSHANAPSLGNFLRCPSPWLSSAEDADSDRQNNEDFKDLHEMDIDIDLPRQMISETETTRVARAQGPMVSKGTSERSRQKTPPPIAKHFEIWSPIHEPDELLLDSLESSETNPFKKAIRSPSILLVDHHEQKKEPVQTTVTVSQEIRGKNPPQISSGQRTDNADYKGRHHHHDLEKDQKIDHHELESRKMMGASDFVTGSGTQDFPHHDESFYSSQSSRSKRSLFQMYQMLRNEAATMIQRWWRELRECRRTKARFDLSELLKKGFRRFCRESFGSKQFQDAFQETMLELYKRKLKSDPFYIFRKAEIQQIF
eukprot:TRINITY_DN6172_c0_g1_i8.p1 TRINITY_DN6172_c0_g1~~TRINITY_DN6172_c0_g1_i8.p1  ORF type:complete len:387 (-),score=64.71 TRINITY_DN6172_c0_g1_i8:377-1537(-)